MFEGTVCTCCLSTDDLHDIFTDDDDDEERNYAKAIENCFNVEILKSDGHDSICGNCIDMLQQAVSLKKKLLQSISILTSANANELLGVNKIELIFDDDESIKTERSFANTEYDDEGSESAQTSSENYKKQNKRQRGRPRKKAEYIENKMPYTVDNAELSCRECGEDFPTNLLLKSHYKLHFPYFVCDICHKGFISRASLKKHNITHIEGPFPCTLCDKVFKSLNSLSSHKRFKHSGTPMFKCSKCDQRFMTATKRMKHYHKFHGAEEKRYKCYSCDKKFASSFERTKHKSKFHAKATYQCPLCDYKSTSSDLRKHLATKHSLIEKKYGCDYCGKCFAKKWNLSEHIRSHMKDYKFKCEICSRGFIQKSALNAHYVTH